MKYRIYDSINRVHLKQEYCSYKRARNKADKLNLEYGAEKYIAKHDDSMMKEKMDKIINRLKQGERLLQASCEFGFNYYIRYSENVFFFEKWKRNLETEQEVLCNVECINENTVRCALRAR